MERTIQVFIEDERELLVGSKDGIPFLKFEGENIWDLGYDTEPHAEFKQPEGYPNCCEYHRGLFQSLVDWFELFPNCCDRCKRFSLKPWFDKEKYQHIPEKVMRQLSFTMNFIDEKIDQENWFDEITNYIHYTVESFGTPNIGGDRYLGSLEQSISGQSFEGKPNATGRKNKLLLYVKDRRNPAEKSEAGFDLLYSTFATWLQAFPNLPFFTEIKRKWTGKIPLNIMLHDSHFNRFEGLESFKLRSKVEFVGVLISLTKNLLGAVDTPDLFTKGMITSPEKYRIDLLGERHRNKQDKLLKEYEKCEMAYLKVINRWLKNELLYFTRLEEVFQYSPNLKQFSELSYEKILRQIYNFGQNLEKYQHLYQEFDEERFRDFFLPLLNQISPLHSATGESFNKIGKTDILMQDMNGVNILLVECKIWKGETALSKAVDQLLNRYATWRDDKTALMVFNKQKKNFGDLLDKSVETLRRHPLFLEYKGQREETSFSFTFRHPDDINKQIKLELIVFNCLQ